MSGACRALALVVLAGPLVWGCDDGGESRKAPAPASQPGAEPALEVPIAVRQEWFPQVFRDLGEVDEGTVHTHSFPFRNPTGQARRILSLHKDCACARAAVHYQGREIQVTNPLIPPLELPAGAEGRIEVVLDTTAIVGPKEARVTVQTDDPAAQWLRVGLKATSRLYFWPDSRQVALGEIGSADTRGFRVRLYSKEVQRWRVVKVEAPPEYRLELSPYDRLDGRDVWQVDGQVGPGLKPGDHSASLIFHTDYKNRSIAVAVTLAVRPPWEVALAGRAAASRPAVLKPDAGLASEAQPAGGAPPPGPVELRFGPVPRGQGRSLELVVRNLTRQRRLKITGLRLEETDRPLGGFRLDPREAVAGGRYDLTFTALGTLPPGPFRGVLVVRTNDPDLPEARVPFSGFVR